MADSNTLFVDLDALTDKYFKKLDAAMERLEKLGEKKKKTSKTWGDSLMDQVKAVSLAYAGIESTRKIADAVKNLFLLESQYRSMLMPLKNITEQNGNFGASLSFIQNLADRTGQNIFVLADSYKNIYASAMQAGMGSESLNNIFKSVVNSGAALKLSNEQVSLSLKAIEQMMNKGVISSEELRQQLGDHIPGAYSLMAKAAKDAGISTTGTTQELAKLLDEGKVASNEVLPFFAKRMEEAFGKNANENINTITGSANRLRNELTYLMNDLDNGKVLGFWANFQNGIAEVFKDIRSLVNSGSWNSFIQAISGSTGYGLFRAERIGKESMDSMFSSKSRKEQIEYLNTLIAKFRDAKAVSDGFIKAGMGVDTKYLQDMSNQIGRFANILRGEGNGEGIKGEGAGGSGKNVIDKISEKLSTLKDFAKEAKKEIALLTEELSFVKLKESNPILSATKLKNTGQINAEKMDLFNEIAKAVGWDGSGSGDKLQQRFQAIAKGISGHITNLKATISTDALALKELGTQAFMEATQAIGDTISNGFALMFSGNVDFKKGFRKILASFLQALGDMVMKMATQLKAVALLKTKVEAALETLGTGGIALAGAVGLFALGAAIKGGGMAMAGNANSSIASSSNYSGNSYQDYRNSNWGGGNSQNITFPKTVQIEFKNGSLQGYLDFNSGRNGI